VKKQREIKMVDFAWFEEEEKLPWRESEELNFPLKMFVYESVICLL